MKENTIQDLLKQQFFIYPCKTPPKNTFSLDLSKSHRWPILIYIYIYI